MCGRGDVELLCGKEEWICGKVCQRGAVVDVVLCRCGVVK